MKANIVLAVKGQNLVLSMNDRSLKVAVYNRTSRMMTAIGLHACRPICYRRKGIISALILMSGLISPEAIF
jgi:hypothetical protein